MPVTTNTEPDGELLAAAERLLDAAMELHAARRKAGLAGAVAWVEDTDGRMVILTRGEYRHTLLQNIDRLHAGADEPILSFDPPHSNPQVEGE
jgi:hypothetical protein